jgi:ferredoxin
MTKVNKEKCIGCGACASICSKVFEMKGGKASIKTQDKPDCVDEAVKACPVQAISK